MLLDLRAGRLRGVTVRAAERSVLVIVPLVRSVTVPVVQVVHVVTVLDGGVAAVLAVTMRVRACREVVLHLVY